MKVTAEQREVWAANTRDSPFNQWMRSKCARPDGTLDLSRLHLLAQEHGIDPAPYAHLNPGQQRMNIGNRLRALIDPSLHGAAAAAAAAAGEPAGVAPAPRPLADRSTAELLRLQADVVAELRHRNIVRTGNAPLGDYAEWLFAGAFGWRLEDNSFAAYDATDGQTRYQIKARRVVAGQVGARKLGVVRHLDEASFDILAAVLFDAEFRVLRAALIPHWVVLARATRVKLGWSLNLTDAVWAVPGVEDVTERLRAYQAAEAR